MNIQAAIEHTFALQNKITTQLKYGLDDREGLYVVKHPTRNLYVHAHKDILLPFDGCWVFSSIEDANKVVMANNGKPSCQYKVSHFTESVVVAVPLNSALISELEYLNVVMDALTEKQTKDSLSVVEDARNYKQAKEAVKIDIPMVDVDPADLIGIPTVNNDSWIMDDEIDEMKATYYPVRKD